MTKKNQGRVRKKNQRGSTLVLMIKYMQVKQYFLFHFTLFDNKSFDRIERNEHSVYWFCK